MKKKREQERCAFKISKKRKDIFRQQQKKQQLIHRSILIKIDILLCLYILVYILITYFQMNQML